MQLHFVTVIALLGTSASAIPSSTLFSKRSITCLAVGQSATATWKNSAGKTCTWTGVVGSNFGANSANGGEYSCNGRCGAGCSGTALGNVYTQDCFSHDVCSWFNNASGGASDVNCGAAYNSAVDDTLMGLIAGCSQTNPSNEAVKPSMQPTCT
ncbi:hypothetical protein BU23DRAFT_457431 [Bimuria novae-zelandiae CBS 107.79]|uniref:DUF8213 domain-containing protein n=1 Tax=Bimuria novae-zelandiae CBS 107.79 TaxID=1447943 RepID=A0A6A5VF95_9PLEO|nr:hypothetical protein BU23DRAFT_457431 [Bimuria novae-zelandiae CBS 107.79]